MNFADFERIIGGVLFDPGPVGVARDREDEDGEFVGYVLATKVPEACKVCGGAGRICAHSTLGMQVRHVVDCGTYRMCDQCPTVAKLLAIGVAVMTAEVNDWSVEVEVGPQHTAKTDGVKFLMEILQSVEL